MRLFSEKVTPTYTRSAVNILTVEDFQEVFYDVYELTINKKQFIAEKVSEYKGAPVVDIPVLVEGVEETLSFVLAKGKFEVLVGRSSGSIPIEENYQTPRTIRYSDKGNTVEEVVYDSSEAINSEIKSTKDQLQQYNENVKLERKINRYITDCKNEIFVELESKYDDTILALERSDIELNRFVIDTTNEALDKVGCIKSEFKNSLETTAERLTDSIELAESRIKNYYNNKLSLIEERVQDISEENKQYFLQLVSESKRNLLKEISDLKKAAPNLINEKAFQKQNVDLKGIKSELEKVIGTKFSSEISALRRLIELSSGGGSVAMQFAEGGFMNGNLTVNGLISAQNLTITGTISTTMLEAMSANIRYLDINTYELSGFHSTGNVDIDGNLTVSETITGQNLTISDTISTTTLNAISANIKFLNIDTYELSGFHSTGNVSIDGNLSVSQTITAQNLTVSGTLSTTMLEALSANITYIDIKQYELSGFDVTGDVAIAGNLSVSETITGRNLTISETISAQNLAVTGTISATMIEALSANIRYLNINTYELSGFDVSGDVNIDGDLTVTGAISGNSYVNDPTGRVIIVDNITGTDSRGSLLKYDQFKPYKTIEAAVTDSSSGDTVYVRAGSYNIISQISLNGKGNIYFETGSDVTVSGTVVAFALTANETKTINGFANFTVSNTGGMLSQSDGIITLEYDSVISSSTGTLFTITGGTLTTSFTNINASTTDGFILTGSATLIIRRSHTATCKQFLNCNTTGSVTIDLWSVVGTSTDSTLRMSNNSGVSYRGVSLDNTSNSPCITFAYSSSGTNTALHNLRLATNGIPIVCENNGTFRDVFLDSIKLATTNVIYPSISSTPSSTTLYSTTTYSNVLPHSSVTIEGQYNVMTKIF